MKQPHSKNTFNALDYEQYEQTPRGRLRSEMIFWQLEKWLEKNNIHSVLDVGCGIGSLAIRLGKIGCDITAVDPEENMLQIVRKRATTENILIKTMQSSLEKLDLILDSKKFDLVICHSVLQFTDNPTENLFKLKSFLTTNGMLSLEIPNIASPIFYHVFFDHNFLAAKESLENSYTLSYRFRVQDIVDMIKNSSLSLEATYGMRVFFDYLPDIALEDPKKLEQLLDLEKAVCEHEPYRSSARFIHTIAKNVV